MLHWNYSNDFVTFYCNYIQQVGIDRHTADCLTRGT